jgi:hypothetical protein
VPRPVKLHALQKVSSGYLKHSVTPRILDICHYVARRLNPMKLRENEDLTRDLHMDQVAE